MNPGVYKRKLERKEEEREVKEKKKKKARFDEVDEILEKVEKELKFLKSDPSLDQFAEQLRQREREKLTTQLQREELVREQCPPGIYAQFTCDWFINGLGFAGPGWRHLF